MSSCQVWGADQAGWERKGQRQGQENSVGKRHTAKQGHWQGPQGGAQGGGQGQGRAQSQSLRRGQELRATRLRPQAAPMVRGTDWWQAVVEQQTNMSVGLVGQAGSRACERCGEKAALPSGWDRAWTRACTWQSIRLPMNARQAAAAAAC